MKSHQILVVEDEKDLNKAYQTILTGHGYKVIGVYDGRDALEKVRSETPALILLDMNMPKMSGLEFLDEINSLKDKPSVIIFSNKEQQKDIDEAFRLGAKRYLVKAWASPRELVKVVEQVLDE